MVTVIYMPTAPGRHTLATWISCHFLHLQIETQITSSGGLWPTFVLSLSTLINILGYLYDNSIS